MLTRYLFLLIVSLLTTTSLSAQTTPDESNEAGSFELGDWTLRPVLGFQGWGTYTMGHQDWDPARNAYVDADNRLNFMVRRFRWGSTAKVGDRLFIKFLGAVDFLGADQRAGTVGGVNIGGFPEAQVWDLYVRYKLSPNGEGLYIVGGYLRPPLGRESMSGAMGVSSFEKGFNQWYIRQHLVGTGPGGVGGVYLGGLRSFTEGFHVDYRGGVFNPQNNAISAGRRAAPLFVSRVNLMFGDAEKNTWTYGLAAANSFGKRRGASVALILSREGGTGAAPAGVRHVAVDAVVSSGHWHAEGEWHRMVRNAPLGTGLPDNVSQTYMLRTGFNIDVTPAGGASRYLEPALMVYGFRGALTLEEYATVLATNYFGGEEIVYDLGLNYHLLPGRVRLGLHYTGTSGDRGELPADGQLGWFHRQAGIGGIRRGNYLGAEVIFNY